MKAFLLAAGYGERLRPVTDIVPKPLVPVVNVPCVCYPLALIREAGIREVVCNLHYRDRDITDFFGEHDSFGLTVRFSFEKEILGTGGGLKRCEDLLSDGPFILMNSDIVTDLNLDDLINYHRGTGKSATLVLVDAAERGRKGTVAVREGLVADFNGILGSGASHDYEYTGIAVLSPEIFTHLSAERSSIVSTGFAGLTARKGISCYLHRGLWEDIGTVEQFRQANCRVLANKDLQERIKTYAGITPAAISESARIGRDVRIESSVLGERCEVHDGAWVSESVLLPGAVAHSGEKIGKRVIFSLS